MAELSPLRFHYDSETFNLPIRLGLVNSSGTQDLIVHILARGKRYEVANYKNVTIPTNIDIDEKARGRFGEFYAALFDRTVETNPGAIVTEYSWGADSCDPCPSSPLDPGDFATLGGDVVPGVAEDQKWVPTNSFVLTRLHARYGKNALGEDLVFRVAKPIVGGREFNQENGKLETGAREMPEGGISNFQGRYAIRHPWTGPIKCKNPKRGVWGGPPEGTQASGTQVAQDLAFAPRGQLELASFVAHPVPEINLAPKGASAVPGPGELPPAELARKSGCAACAIGEAPEASRAAWISGLVAVAGIAGFFARRRR
jgi:MYXO-CTERM domain-containing protein